MASTSPSEQDRHAGAKRYARWVVLFGASLLLHLILVTWSTGRLALPSPRKDETVVIAAKLRTPPVPPSAAATEAVAEASTPSPKPRRKPRRPAPPRQTEAANSVPAALPDVPPAQAPADVTHAAASVESHAEPAAPAQAEAAPSGKYKFNPPPTAELRYSVQALRDGKQWFGSGVFHWEATPTSYRITGEASVTILFSITVLNFSSEGAINEFGIAPVLYSEKPWRKAMTNTHFQHDKQTISFSASQAQYPYKGGEQDRASVTWQLAGIGRGDASQFAPGASFEILVAGARNADAWRMDVIGLEEIETPVARMQAWHVVRTPRAGTHDQKIDIWLAPGQEWYPAKMRHTYVNGDYLEMLLDGVSPRATSGAAQAKNE